MKGMLFVTGDKALDKTLRGLPFRIQGRILRTALKDALQPVLSEVKVRFPKDTGRTARRFRIKTTKPKRDGSRSARVGIFGKATGGKKKDFVTARAVEFGTVELPARFPLRRSLATKQDEALARLTQLLRQQIPIEAERFAREQRSQ